MLHGYNNIQINGGDTGTPLNISKRTAFIRNYVVPSVSKIIDCGCGEGRYVLSLTRTFAANVIGIEYQQDKIINTLKDPELHNRIVCGDIEHIPFPDYYFDVALLNEVLEHIPDERLALSEIHRILAQKGLLIIFAPNRWYPFETHGVYLRKNNKKVPPWVPFIPYVPLSIGNRIFEYWARNYWQSEIVHLICSARFEIVERSWIWQTFENITGVQPDIIRFLQPLLRSISNICQRIPMVQRFGVSQVIVAKKLD